ncbi:hypothetical protein IWQ56_002082 [Coemansia nantahalensis]|nr:hypothetical protein IWQ56_002082 [Coemansia nantahalensis]
MIDPAPLRHLSLFDVVANFEWNIFASTGADGQVVFPNLYKLSIRYSAAGGRTDAAAADDGGCMGVRLRFPVLKRLHVFQCPQNCVLLSKAIYPPKLHRAVIECASGTGTLEKISGLVPSRELTVVMTHMDSDDMGSYYRAANKGFGSGAAADRLSLVLRTRRAVPDPARINWTHLAALNVHTSITTTTLLGLLAKMPNLDRLSATHLISSHRSDEFRVSHHHPSKDGQLRPMLPQARHVALRFVAELSLHHRDAGFVLYLITGMTALKSLSTTPTMQARLAKLVAKHASEHPHLQQIRLAAAA